MLIHEFKFDRKKCDEFISTCGNPPRMRVVLELSVGECEYQCLTANLKFIRDDSDHSVRVSDYINRNHCWTDSELEAKFKSILTTICLKAKRMLWNKKVIFAVDRSYRTDKHYVVRVRIFDKFCRDNSIDVTKEIS